MKKGITLSMFAMALLLVAFMPKGEEAHTTLEIGTEMPLMDYAMLDVSGEEQTMNDVKKEKGTVVIFSCNTCPFVTAWEDRYDDIAQIAARVKVGVVLVNSNEAKRDGADSYEAMKRHATSEKYMTPYLVDENSKLANTFGAKTTPHVFAFDADDKLVYEGAIDDNFEDRKKVTANYLQDVLMALHQGTEIDPATTPAKGCSIKRVK